MKRCEFSLRSFPHQAIKLRTRRLIKAYPALHLQDLDRVQQPESADGIGVSGVFRLQKGNCHMALGRQVIDFIGPHRLHDADEAVGIGHVAIVQKQTAFCDVRILVEMIDALCIEQRRAALDAMDFIVLAQQELRQVRTVLPGNARNERFPHEHLCLAGYKPARVILFRGYGFLSRSKHHRARCPKLQ